MVLIFSTHSNDSEQVLREVQLAVNSHLHIVQFRIEDVVLSDDLQYYLGTPQWLDALNPPLEAHFERLQQAISNLLGTATGRPETKRLPSHSSFQQGDDLADATLFSATIELTAKPGSRSEFFDKLRLFVANFVSEKVNDVMTSLEERETIASTGTGFGLACPHAYRPHVKRHFVGVIFIPSGCDWDAVDGRPVYIVVLYIGTKGARTAQALRITAAAHRLGVSILSKIMPQPPTHETHAHLFEALREALLKSGLSVGVVSFS